MPVALPEPDGEREGIPLWLCPTPTAISSSPWKTTGGGCERILFRASKSGSSKVGAIAVWKRKLRTEDFHNR